MTELSKTSVFAHSKSLSLKLTAFFPLREGVDIPTIYMLLGLLTWFDRQNLVKVMASQVYSQASSNLVLFCSFSLSLFTLSLWGKPWLIEGFRDTWKVSYFRVGFLVQHALVDLLVNQRFMSADKTNQAWLGSSEPHNLTRDVRNDWFL